MKVLCIKKWSSLFGHVVFEPGIFYDVHGHTEESVSFIQNQQIVSFNRLDDKIMSLHLYFKTIEQVREDQLNQIGI